MKTVNCASSRVIGTLVTSLGLLVPIHPLLSEDNNEGRKSQLSSDDVAHAFKHNATLQNSVNTLFQGRQIFRFDTYGDQAFWGDTLQLHQALNQLTPRQALALGLKIDSEALSESLQQSIRKGKINLDDPAVTLALIKRNAVLGVVGFFDGRQLSSVGLTCAICHSTVNSSLAPGIGQRLDGWAN